ncbi:histidinol phosphate phosphatase domain-containing protein [Candidatus Dependentiae bacterium]|nr:histidinol phosphate phosphatase domain-containing protein [Candidatus Dependentiae bacterium]
MINMHCHTFFSDGALSPSELLYRCVKLKYRATAITDHADESNFEFLLTNIKKTVEEFNKKKLIKVLTGIELTYVIPENISKIAKECKKLGAEIIVVHGETLVEPVPAGTNLNAVKCRDVDILAHPGFINKDEIKLAKKNNICLEITSRSGHSLANGYVAKNALKYGAKLILNTDAHQPDDLIDIDFAVKTLAGAGLDKSQICQTFKNSEILAGF